MTNPRDGYRIYVEGSDKPVIHTIEKPELLEALEEARNALLSQCSHDRIVTQFFIPRIGVAIARANGETLTNQGKMGK